MSHCRDDSWADALPEMDSDAVTNAMDTSSGWSNDAISTSPTESASDPCSPNSQQTEFTDPDGREEECGDFVSASLSSPKQLVYNAGEDVDETLEILSTHSVPEMQTGVFSGMGILEPIFAKSDMSTRILRRVGKDVRLKRFLKKKMNKLSEEESTMPDTYDNNKDVQNDVSEVQEVSASLGIVNIHDESDTGPAIPERPLLDGVMRPVSFSQAESQQGREMNDIIEERQVWVP